MEIFVIIFFICVIIYFFSKTSRHQSQTKHKSIPLNSEQNKYAKTKSININNKNLKLNQNYGSLTLNFVKSNSVSDYIIYFPKSPILNNSKLYPITVVRWLQENGKKFDSQKPVVELRLDNYIAQGVILGFTGILHIGKKAGDTILEGEELCRVSFYNQKTSKQIESTYNNKFDLNNPVNIVPNKNFEDHSNNLLAGIKLLPIKINYLESDETKNGQGYDYLLNVKDINYFGKNFENAIVKRWYFKNGDYVSSGAKINELLLDNNYPAFSYSDRSGYLKILHSESKKINNTDIIYKILPIKSSLISEPILNPINNVNYQTDEDIIEVDNYNTSIMKNEPIENITDDYLKEFWLCLPYPNNNRFTNSIPDAENLTDTIYLNIIELFKEYYSLKGTNILDNLELTPKRIFQIKKMRQEGSYYNSPDFYDDYSFRYEFVNIFNRVHHIVDGIIRIKYDLNSDLKGYLHVLKALNIDNYSEEIENKLIGLQKLVPELDQNSEIEINKNYTSRWKNKFQQIKDSKEITIDKNKIISELEELIYNNQKNNTLRNIYFEASKLIYDIDLFKSVWYYSMYKHISKNGNFNWGQGSPMPASSMPK